MTIISLAEKVDNSSFLSPKQMLENTLKYLEENPEMEEKYKKAIILFYDDKGDNCDVEYFFANLRFSETLVMADLLHAESIRHLGY